MLGTTIAHYKVTAKLGQGGMGEVYRATDTKLDREVAIKVLPQSVAQDKERLARFEREAKVLAQLNHHNIAGVYGLEQSGDTQALILELVEGDDLSVRLKRGPLPVEEALEVCKQIAEALEAAHEKGIIHRDLKPGNIKLTQDGRVKVLDFGLAKALSDESGIPSISSAEDSPTITDAFTKPGTILGTAAYMSPEQARGKHVDKRTDIWAFGCVLFECLTGRRAFEGEDVTDTLARIVQGNPDWSIMPNQVPPVIQLLLRKCLVKDRKKRWQHINDAVVDLVQAVSDPDNPVLPLTDSLPRTHHQGANASMARLIGVGFCMLFLGGIVTWFLKPAPQLTAPPVKRVIPMNLGDAEDLKIDVGASVKISPDESMLAYMVKHRNEASSGLMIRRLDGLETKYLEGSEGVVCFCFSPDSKWICFGKHLGKITTINKISIHGGAVTHLANAGSPRGVSWSDDGWIYYAGSRTGIKRVRDSGGESFDLSSLGEEIETHRWPQILPGGKAFLFVASDNNDYFSDASIMVQSITGEEPRELVKGHFARYLHSGHLVYIHKGALYADPFDLETLEMTKNQNAPVIDHVVSNSKGGAHIDVSPAGTLVYVRGQNPEDRFQLEWVDRTGEREPLDLKLGMLDSYRISPDGKEIVYSEKKNGQSDIWIYNIERGSKTRLTSGSSEETHPIWSPDGKYIAFSSDQQGASRNIYCIPVDRSRGMIRLTDSDRHIQLPWDWHPHGHSIAMIEMGKETNRIKIVPLERATDDHFIGKDVLDFADAGLEQWSPAFSPDGNWLAYSSAESGKWEIYVRSFPEGLKPWQISLTGKASGYPVWSKLSSKILYSSQPVDMPREHHQVMVSEFLVKEQSLQTARPTQWLGATSYSYGGRNTFDLDPLSDRILVRKRDIDPDAENQKENRVILFQNFYEHLLEKMSQ